MNRSMVQQWVHHFKVIANIFMEDFVENANSTSYLKSKLYLQYVDDTYVIWPHGKDTLEEFLKHLNPIHNGYGM